MFQAKYQVSIKKEFQTSTEIIDNVASKAVQAYLEKEGVGIRLVKTHKHCVNAVERAIKTFKSHLIAGLSTCDASLP